MTVQLNFYFDRGYCTGCATCQIACKDKNNLKPGEFYRRVSEYEGGGYTETESAVIPHVYTYWKSVSCNHCKEPACIQACPIGAITKNPEDGIVLLHGEKCTGCGNCLKSCPYHAITLLSETGKAGKCDFCRDLLAKGQEPACVSSCPMRALHVQVSGV